MSINELDSSKERKIVPFNDIHDQMQIGLMKTVGNLLSDLWVDHGPGGLPTYSINEEARAFEIIRVKVGIGEYELTFREADKCLRLIWDDRVQHNTHEGITKYDFGNFSKEQLMSAIGLLLLYYGYAKASD